MTVTPQDRARELADLLARTALGDRKAFQQLYERSSAHLLGVILRIQRDRAQAEDVLQEVYVNVWNKAASFDAQRAQANTWLTSVARNRAIDSLRRRQTEPDLVSRHRAGAGAEDDDDDILMNFASDDPTPQDLLIQAADSRSIRGCVSGLSAEQQQSIALAFYQGLSHAEVADHLRQPLGTVKSWVRRGLQSLRVCLERAGMSNAAALGA
ncbi:MAG: sigma-70 family RNA polymerase sigma factor [Leptothrix sp. (in: b-proteobacteria)]